MKRTVSLSCLAVAIAASALTTPAAAQGFAVPVGPYEDFRRIERPLPPRAVPNETVVTTTTTRRVVTTRPIDDGFDAPAVVTTRRVARPAPVLVEDVDDLREPGGFVRPLPPRPPLARVVKSEPVFVPAPVVASERFVTTRRVAPPPVVVEERRVETTRRVLRPVESELD